MNQALKDLAKKDVFVDILSEEFSDEDLQRIFSFHGEIKFPESMNNGKKLKTGEQIVINFKSRGHLLRTMVALYMKSKEIRENDFLINSLPDDVLFRIFSFLPLRDKFTVGKVCKRWRDLSDKIFAGMEELDVRHYSSRKILYSISKRCGPFIKKLKFSDCLAPDCLQMAIKFCKLDQLTEIHFDCRYFHPLHLYLPNLTKLLEKPKKLVTLVITRSLEDYDINWFSSLRSSTEDSIIISLNRFPKLRELSCRNVHIVSTERQMKTNSRTPMNLEKLELYSNRISRSFVENIKCCTNLKKIFLGENNHQLTTDDILDIVKNCQKIEELHFDRSFVVTPQCIQEFSKMPSLEILSIVYPVEARIGDLQHLTNLKELTITDCDCLLEYWGLIQLITNSSRLSKLSFFNAISLGESFLKDICDIFNNGLHKTPLTLMIQVKHNFFSREYNHYSRNSLLKLEIIQDSSEGSVLRCAHSRSYVEKWIVVRGESGSDECPEREVVLIQID